MWKPAFTQDASRVRQASKHIVSRRPCADECGDIFSRCFPLLLELGDLWPEQMGCGRFPPCAALPPPAPGGASRAPGTPGPGTEGAGPGTEPPSTTTAEGPAALDTNTEASASTNTESDGISGGVTEIVNTSALGQTRSTTSRGLTFTSTSRAVAMTTAVPTNPAEASTVANTVAGDETRDVQFSSSAASRVVTSTTDAATSAAETQRTGGVDSGVTMAIPTGSSGPGGAVTSSVPRTVWTQVVDIDSTTRATQTAAPSTGDAQQATATEEPGQAMREEPTAGAGQGGAVSTRGDLGEGTSSAGLWTTDVTRRGTPAGGALGETSAAETTPAETTSKSTGETTPGESTAGKQPPGVMSTWNEAFTTEMASGDTRKQTTEVIAPAPTTVATTPSARGRCEAVTVDACAKHYNATAARSQDAAAHAHRDLLTSLGRVVPTPFCMHHVTALLCASFVPPCGPGEAVLR